MTNANLTYLPLKGTVLLPSAVLTIKISANSPTIRHPGKPFIVIMEGCDIGTGAKISQLSRKSDDDGYWMATLLGTSRYRVLASHEDAHIAHVELIDERSEGLDPEHKHLVKQIVHNSAQLFSSIQGLHGSSATKLALKVVKTLEKQRPGKLADVIGGLVAREREERIAVLKAVDLAERLQLVDELLRRALHRALNQSVNIPSIDTNETEADLLIKKLKEKGPPEEVMSIALREHKRASQGGDHQPGHAIGIAYLQVLADLPWSITSNSSSTLSLMEIRRTLDEDHCGLEDVKQRIVQYAAVRRLKGEDAPAPILCLVGPPGVGKTSLAKSIARILGRSFQRISLGGVRDESEIRGHRRTYIGAMPGRIVQSLRRAQVKDPLLLLDEIDKLGRDATRGDPAAALLEVLDPEQNKAFVDTYLGVQFDLSQIIFVATANNVSEIPPPLLDRMEVVYLNGYTVDERVEIARAHLVPKALDDHGIRADQLSFPRGSLRLLANGWTRETGVRSLARAIAAMCRHVAAQLVSLQEEEQEVPVPHTSIAEEPLSLQDTKRFLGWFTPSKSERLYASSQDPCGLEEQPAIPSPHLGAGVARCEGGGTISVDQALIEAVLGPCRYQGPDSRDGINGVPGIAAGLVWTTHGGQLQYIECVAVDTTATDTGSFTLTGQLGDILEESARIALSWIRSNAGALGLSSGPGSPVRSWDLHLHLPAGAIPKDGPSAGITLATAMVSLFTNRPMREDTALTGELTLRGLVLPVGGLKAKIIAAANAGMKRVLIPARSAAIVAAELSREKLDVEIIPCNTLADVLHGAFEPPIEMGDGRAEMAAKL